APNGGNATSSLSGSWPNTWHGFVELGAQGCVGSAGRDDNRVVGVAELEVVDQAAGQLRAQLAHDALRRLIPAALIRGPTGIAPAKGIVWRREAPGILRIAESCAVLLG